MNDLERLAVAAINAEACAMALRNVAQENRELGLSAQTATNVAQALTETFMRRAGLVGVYPPADEYREVQRVASDLVAQYQRERLESFIGNDAGQIAPPF
jgi:hypothetical protein